MHVVHLTDSPFYGGPERQIHGLALTLPASIRTTILCFRDHGSSAPFLEKLTGSGVAARMVAQANPHFLGIIADVAAELREGRADLLVCQGYKADILGWIAARRAGVPVMSVSRGFTAHTWKVRLYEALDRRMLQHMEAVTCVSAGQAAKVVRAGVRANRVRVIHDSVDPARFAAGGAAGRAILQSLFPTPRDVIIVGVGRQSPEKGFDQLVEASRRLIGESDRVGVVLIGDGPDRPMLEERVRAAGLSAHVMFAGFRTDIDRLLPGADILAQGSFTEGLPNVVLEACAAGIPVVATNVGGTSEIIDDGVNGFLVPAADPAALAERLLDLVRAPERRRAMGARGREIARSRFSFAQQAREYAELFDTVAREAERRTTPGLPPMNTTLPHHVR
jgi:glycosyltransferase involved in cell wall biosynthesis